MQEDVYISYLKKHLSEKRIAHSLLVARTAVSLAKLYHVNEEKAYIAGILHDVGKGIPEAEIVSTLGNNNYALTADDLLVPEVLHAALSEIMVKEIGINDPVILQAISRHTTGDIAMTKLDAIIYIADMIEPSRNFPGVQELREVAENDLYLALVACLGHTIKYLVSQGGFIHPRTLETYNWLLQNKTLQA